MATEGGKSIIAVAKEKAEARREYEAALQRGDLTGLVEYVNDDSKINICETTCS